MSESSNVPDTPAERRLDGLARGLYDIRIPLALGIVTILALTLSEQVLEVHRVLTQERANDPLDPQWLFALGSLAALSIVLWQIARQHADEAEGDGYAFTPHPSADGVHRWGPRVIAMLPLLGAAIGIWLSTSPYLEAPSGTDVLSGILRKIARLKTDFLIGSAICAGLAVLMFAIAHVFERGLAPVKSRRARNVAVFSNWLLFPLLVLISIVLLVRDPVHLPQVLGSIPVFSLWMVNIAVLFGLFSRYYRLFGIPFFGVLIVLLVIFEVLGLTDNHQFRHKEASVQQVASRQPAAGDAQEPAIQRPRVEDAFQAWLSSRKDLKTYQDAGKPYPVYIVAAEGGGLYAAYQTAKILGRLQDLCPNFTQHVFLMSAVSGGSLGAAVHAGLSRSLTNDDAKPCLPALEAPGPFERRAHRILSRDFLSPVVWSGLFPDFLQRFIPYPIPVFDRARALELAFEAAWQRGGETGENPLRDSLFALCGAGQPACASGAVPALALNATNVETGMQMVLSQLDFASIAPPWFSTGRVYDAFYGVDPVDLPLSTAVGLSARFPWISPAGWFSFYGADEKENEKKTGKTARKRRMSFVDGGYVDNSGVATASKVVMALAEYMARDPALPKVELKLIMISAAWLPFERFWMDEPSDRGKGELFSPFAAAIAAWQGRGFTTQYDLSADPQPSFQIIEAGVYYNFMPLPLGWHLSRLSRDYINLFKGHPDKCDESNLERNLQSHGQLAISYINRANCFAARIARDLTPAAAPAPTMRSITPSK